MEGMARRTLIAVATIGVLTVISVIVAFLADEGLERASWWAAVCGVVLATFLAVKEAVVRSRSGHADAENDSRLPDANGSSNIAHHIQGQNIQIGNNNSNITIARD